MQPTNNARNSPVNEERLRDLSIDRDVMGTSGHDEDVTSSSTWRCIGLMIMGVRRNDVNKITNEVI